MTTQQNVATPHRDGRSGGALDPETRQQVAELNLRGIEALRALLAAAGGAAGGPILHGRSADSPALPGARTRRRARHDARSGLADTGRDPGAARLRASRAARIALARTGLSAAILEPLRRDGPALPDALRLLSDEWLSLDEAARHRLATCPYLLFELDVAGLLNAAAVPPRFVQEARGVPGAASAIAASFAGAEGRGFARLLIHYAWHLVRSAPTAAAFVLGASQAVLDPLRTLGLSRVESLAGTASGWVRLRWDQEPLIWIDWLEAARGDDPAALWASQLRGLQRIAGACRDTPPSA